MAGDKTGAYRYLASSVETFKPRAQMVAELEAAGFTNVEDASPDLRRRGHLRRVGPGPTPLSRERSERNF